MSETETGYSKPSLRLLLPSDGDLHQPTLDFLKACGLAVRRPNARRYTASIPAIPGVRSSFSAPPTLPERLKRGAPSWE